MKRLQFQGITIFLVIIIHIHTWHNTEGLVGDSEDWFCGNFFGWKTDADSIHPQEGGSSGSPLLKNGIVYGVLHAGYKEYPRICMFTTASFVKRLMLDYLLVSFKSSLLFCRSIFSIYT